jgi:hypothetical protein
MFRTVLITLATLLAVGVGLTVRQAPLEPASRAPVRIVAWLAVFFALFFVVVRFLDGYYLWLIPCGLFVAVAVVAADRAEQIKNFTKTKSDQWLSAVQTAAASASTERTPAKENDMAHKLSVMDWDEEFEGLVEPEELNAAPGPRRFLDDFVIADEADLGPTPLELDRLDDFIFTSRHGYLVHDRGEPAPLCDVVTILPGMSIADLIEVATQHSCSAREVAA